MNIDVFNGDADGLCALQQLRLAQPCQAEAVTGVKRDIGLLAKIKERADLAGAHVTVLDVSMAVNGPDLVEILAKGATVFYADHHKSGDIPDHPGLTAHIDLRPATCTSMIINDYLAGAFPGWAVAAAFGDNFHDSAQQLGRKLACSTAEMATLRELGELLNYNGYGRDVTDLHFHPADLSAAMRPYRDPLDFAADATALATLRHGFEEDMARAMAVAALEERETGRVYLFDNAPWARRVAGVFSNARARQEPDKAHALLVDNGDDSYVVSVRAPLATRQGAVELCQQFPTGGGRAAAAGINRLTADRFDHFLHAFFTAFSHK